MTVRSMTTDCQGTFTSIACLPKMGARPSTTADNSAAETPCTCVESQWDGFRRGMGLLREGVNHIREQIVVHEGAFLQEHFDLPAEPVTLLRRQDFGRHRDDGDV